MRLFHREKLPPLRYGYPKNWRPTVFEIAEYDYIFMQCPWCKKDVWATPYKEPIWLAQKYGSKGAQSGDHTCFNCGRGIFMFGVPWVYFAEFNDDGGYEVYFDWKDLDNKRAAIASGSQCSSNPVEIPLRTWSRSDPDAPTIYTEIRKSPVHPCSIGNHQKSWYFSGYSEVEGALVQWICGRCHIYLGWGKESDGPGAPYQPEPSLEQQAEWMRKGRLLQEEKDRKVLELNSIDVEGECNNRWGINRCPQPAGHNPPHGIPLGNGIILAPWD